MNSTISNKSPWFFIQFKSGLRYALYFMAISFVMGSIYGVFGGLLIEPALFTTSLVGMFCILNFIFAIIAAFINSIFFIFKKGIKSVFRYFGLSLGFALVFISYFYFLHLFKIEVF